MKIFYWLAFILSTTLSDVAQAQFNYITNNDGITITRYTGDGGKVVIPDTINGLPVRHIGDFAFARKPTVTNVSIPDSVVSIGCCAFSATDSSSGLTEITLGEHVASIGMGAFLFCEKLAGIKIPASVINIGAAMIMTNSIPSLTITNTGAAFGGCFGLKEIIVDANNPDYASVDGVLFNRNQTELVQFPPGKAGNYTIPVTVTHFGKNAFWNCPHLTGLTIPNGIIRIEKEEFAACNSLTNIIIPASIKSIGILAFNSCVRLQALCFLGNAPELDKFHGYHGVSDGQINDGGENQTVAYHLSGAMGWGAKFGGLQTALWKPNQPAESSSIYQNKNYGFQFTVPKGWTVTETNFEVFHYNEVFLTVNSRNPTLTLQEQSIGNGGYEFGSKIALQQLEPGECYISIGYFDGPGGPTMRLDSVASDLSSLLTTNSTPTPKESDLIGQDLHFFKRGHFWNICAYLRKPVTEANRHQVRELLKSFHFLDVPVNNVSWAESLAWKELPKNIYASDRWPVVDSIDQKPQFGTRSLIVKKNDFGYSVEFTEDNVGIWKYLVSTNGKVVPEK